VDKVALAPAPSTQERADAVALQRKLEFTLTEALKAASRGGDKHSLRRRLAESEKHFQDLTAALEACAKVEHQ
jgi:hypothetical protein